MNVRQMNKLDMYRTVQAVLRKEPEVWKALPAFVRAAARFQEISDEIERLSLVPEQMFGRASSGHSHRARPRGTGAGSHPGFSCAGSVLRGLPDDGLIEP